MKTYFGAKNVSSQFFFLILCMFCILYLYIVAGIGFSSQIIFSSMVLFSWFDVPVDYLSVFLRLM